MDYFSVRLLSVEILTDLQLYEDIFTVTFLHTKAIFSGL